MEGKESIVSASKHDPRVTAALSIVSTALVGLMTTGVIALFNLNSSVAVLLSRPVGVPREEYARDTLRRDDDFNAFKMQLADMRSSVEKLHDQEVEQAVRQNTLQQQRSHQ